MAKLVSVSINTKKIDKAKLIDGKKGKYLNLTISLNDSTDQYGNNVSVWQGQTEEERKAKSDKNYLGNGKVVWSNNEANQMSNDAPNDDKDILPF